MSAAKPSKKTIYVDVDEEITGIIDKVRSADEQILALVLPKRASMLQSVVNMKLLKRAADHTEKRVVLITSEPNLLPIAGAAGLHVAPNLQSRPYIPTKPGETPTAAAKAAAEKAAEKTPFDPKTPIGDLAEAKNSTDATPIEIDNSPKEAAPEVAAAAAAKPAKKSKDKAKKVPNFNKFRTMLIAGGVLLVVLLFGGYYAMAIAPNATVTLRTESSETDADATFTADINGGTLDLEDAVLPAKNGELKKTETEKVPATGQRDDGTKASGSVKLRNCTDDEVTIPAGTGISNGSQTFITQSSVDLNDDKRDNGRCVDSPSSAKTVKVIAQSNGDQYNLSPRAYVVSGFSGIVAEGEQMSGGTTKTVRIVTAGDIDAAKKRISDRQNTVVEEIKKQLADDGYVGLVDTFTAEPANYVPSPALNAEATEVSVTGEVTYTMLGVREDDIKKIIVEESKDKIDTSKQSILSYGLDDATYEIGKKSGSKTDITVKTTLLAGPEIDQEGIKGELAGKNKGEAEEILKSRPGITEARVDLKPFWVGKVPGKADKVNLIVEQANGEQITD